MKKIFSATNREFLYDASFAFFVAIFIGILLWSPKLAPTDDFIFLDTLQKGKPILYYTDSFPYYNSIELGRFTPLVAMEYNIFGLFSSSPDPFWYFLYHALQASIFALLFVWLLKKFTHNYKLIYGITTILMLSPGFVITMLRLQLNERNLIFFMTLFVLLFLAYLKRQKTNIAVWIVLVANIIIYYKETAFLAIGVFAFTRLIFFWKISNKKTRNLDSLLLLSSLTYLALYFFIVYLHSNLLYLGTSPISLLDYLKRFINYAFFTDALIYLILLPIFIIRLYDVFIKKREPKPLMDPLIAGSIAYSVVYLAIGYGPYYLLPAYAFAIPAIFMYFRGQNKIVIWWKASFVVVAFTIVVNILPSGVHYFTYHKYLMWNFNNTVDSLVDDISWKYSDKRANIFLYGTGRGNGKGAYDVLGDFLVYRGLRTSQFDLKSDVEAPPGPLYVGKTVPPFSIFLSAKAYAIKSGDYLIVPPQSKELVTKNTLDELEKSYDLLFSTKSKLFFPNINLKSLIKYTIIKDGLLDKGLIENENSFASPNYYVFVKS